jgi:hypothetical protein
MELTQLLPEMIMHITSYLSFQDILKFNKTCKTINSVIKEIIKKRVDKLKYSVPEIMCLRDRRVYRDPFLEVMDSSTLLHFIIANYIPTPHPILMIERFIHLFEGGAYDKIWLFTTYFPNYFNKLSHFHWKECWPLSVCQTNYFSIFFGGTYLSPFTLLLYFYNPGRSLPPNSIYNVIPQSQLKFREKLIEKCVRDDKHYVTEENLMIAIRIGDVFSVGVLLREGVVFDYEGAITLSLVKNNVDIQLKKLKEKKCDLKKTLIEIFGDFTREDFYMYILKDSGNISYEVNVAIWNDYYETLSGIFFYNFEYYDIPGCIYSQIHDLLKESYRDYVSDDGSFFDDSEEDLSEDNSIDMERDYYKDYADY